MLTLYKDKQQTTISNNITDLMVNMLERDHFLTWLILEPARDEEIKYFLSEHEEVLYYLFDDESLQEVGAVAICLQDLPEAVEWIAKHWGKNWFSFFVTKHDIVEVIKHMSSLCYLSSHNKMYLFRYYEPVTFSCWVNALKEVKRVDEALGVFSEIYVETPLPHLLMQYILHDDMYTQQTIDLEDGLKGLSFSLSHREVYSPLLDNCWYMRQKEYEYLSPVSLYAFKIKLCKNLVETYHLLDRYTLTEVYTIINNEVSRAMKHSIVQKYLLAHFVNIYFEYPSFWKKSQHMIQKTLEKIEMDEVDRMEIILQAISELEDEKNNEIKKGL